MAKIAETLIAACKGEERSGEKESGEESAEEKKPTPAVDALLRARRELEAVLRPLLSCSFEIGLRGIESGEVEAVIKAAGEHQVRPVQSWVFIGFCV